MILRANALRIPLADASVDLVVGSPPYVDARLYLEDGVDLGISRGPEEWVAWMLEVTAEALRVSRGLVLWVCSGVTRDRNYWPACEGLAWEWFKRGGHAYRPCYWHRYGIPGSGSDQWFRSDIEYVLAFKPPGKLPWADNTANGHKPIHGPGGAMSNRTADGQRTRAFSQMTRRTASGVREAGWEKRPMPELSNPGNLISTGAGGLGAMGSRIAHENEAPYPVDLPKWFIASHCPPGGITLDPFSGSGTTVDAALQLGRRGIGMDLRLSQCRLARRRLRSVTPGFAFAAEAE